MTRLLFFTVGTSLFQSASWEPTPDLLAEVPSYGDLVHHDRLTIPEARAGCRRARLELTAALTEDNAGEWSRRLPRSLVRDGRAEAAKLLRYGAELATLLRLAEQEGGGRSARKFLQDYSGLYVFADPSPPAGDESRRSWVAAAHLAAQLNAVAGGRAAEVVPVPGLSSLDHRVLFGPGSGLPLLCERLVALKAEHDADRVDMVITGGYKIYGLVLARLLGREPLVHAAARLVYGHETGGHLLIVREEEISYDGRSLPASALLPLPGLS